MANLKSVSRTNGFARGNDAIGILLTNSPLLNFLDSMSGFELDATSFDWRPVVAAASLASRAVGGSWSATDVTPASKQTGALTIQGSRVDVDVSHLADRDIGARDIPVWFAKMLKKELINFAKSYEIQMMLGTGSGTAFKGLKTILDGTTALPGYTGITRVTNAATYSSDSTPKSLDITLGATNYDKNIKGLLECLYQAFADMDRGAGMGIAMNAAMYARLQTIARNEHILGEDRTLFGVPVSTFNGIPMVPLTTGAILSTEPDDTTTPLTVCTSLYLISPGEMRTSIVTNSGLEYWEYDFMQAKESGSEKWEIRGAWKIEEPNSVLRIRNIKI
jgi:hypothetical protein